jgi:hypothetical protein
VTLDLPVLTGPGLGRRPSGRVSEDVGVSGSVAELLRTTIGRRQPFLPPPCLSPFPD